jgi:3'(2'), 5'-bisphosphate nucleotidase
MSNNPADRLSELYQLACTTAQGAADILLEHRSHFAISGDTDSPVTSADLAANHHILSNLQEHLGTDDYGYLSEETFTNQNPDDRRKDWVWIIDPLDGTKDYIQNTGDYAVQIALAYQGRPVIAAVACPAQGKLYSALVGSGTWVEDNTGNRRQARVSSRSSRAGMTVITSRNHRGKELEEFIRILQIPAQRVMGSIGCKLSAIVEQDADLYLSISGVTAPKDWDFAAPELILTEAGGKLTYFDGGLILYNREDVNQWNGIIASNGICHEEICNLLNPTTQQ